VSRYSQKRHREVPCSESNCDISAEKILLIQGSPYWLCGLHYEQRKRGLTA